MLIDFLFTLLVPVDQVHFAVCNSQTLRKWPMSKQYFKSLPSNNASIIRKMTLKDGALLPKSDLTHLLWSNLATIVHTSDWTQLVYLKIENGCSPNLVLPPQLQILIGHNIQGLLTLPAMLTHLSLTGSLPRVVGLQRHPTLTVLRCESMEIHKKFEFPPNLTHLQIASCPNIDHWPNNLRFVSLFSAGATVPFCCFPETLEELHLQGTHCPEQINLPIGLRALTLSSLTCVSGENVRQCAKLTKIGLAAFSTNTELREALTFIEGFIPQITDLSLYSSWASQSFADVKFANLTRLKITCGFTNIEENLDLSHLVKVTFLEFRCCLSTCSCIIELPPFLRSLQLRNEWFAPVPFKSLFKFRLPASVKWLDVNEGSRVFHILISRAHLARLDIVGDRGDNEHDGHINTRWGQFILID